MISFFLGRFLITSWKCLWFFIFLLINMCGLLCFSFFVSFFFLLFKLGILQGPPDSHLGLEKMQCGLWQKTHWTQDTWVCAFRISAAVSETSTCMASAAVLARANSASVKLGGASSSGFLSCWKVSVSQSTHWWKLQSYQFGPEKHPWRIFCHDESLPDHFPWHLQLGQACWIGPVPAGHGSGWNWRVWFVTLWHWKINGSSGM